MRPTEHEIWQDEYAAARRERDRQREPEPQRLFPVIRQGAQRNNCATVRLFCPCCLGLIYVASDSDGETVTCINAACHAELETLQIDGKVTLEIATLDMAPDGDQA